MYLSSSRWPFNQHVRVEHRAEPSLQCSEHERDRPEVLREPQRLSYQVYTNHLRKEGDDEVRDELRVGIAPGGSGMGGGSCIQWLGSSPTSLFALWPACLRSREKKTMPRRKFAAPDETRTHASALLNAFVVGAEVKPLTSGGSV